MRGLLLLALLLAPISGRAADPSALWKIVNGQCVPHEESEHSPSPCAAVDIANGVEKGFAVLKDKNGIAQFLLIPTARIGGIEDPALLAPGETNYWEAAWQARSFVEQRLHASLPRDSLSLAINSVKGRTQDQLHIHIDCIRPDVHDILAANLDQITTTWAALPTPLAGHYYRAIRIDRIDPRRGLSLPPAGECRSESIGRHRDAHLGRGRGDVPGQYQRFRSAGRSCRPGCGRSRLRRGIARPHLRDRHEVDAISASSTRSSGRASPRWRQRQPRRQASKLTMPGPQVRRLPRD